MFNLHISNKLEEIVDPSDRQVADEKEGHKRLEYELFLASELEKIHMHDQIEYEADAHEESIYFGPFVS